MKCTECKQKIETPDVLDKALAVWKKTDVELVFMCIFIPVFWLTVIFA